MAKRNIQGFKTASFERTLWWYLWWGKILETTLCGIKVAQLNKLLFTCTMVCYTAVKINLGKIQNTLLIKKCETQRGGENNTDIFHLARICMKKKETLFDININKHCLSQINHCEVYSQFACLQYYWRYKYDYLPNIRENYFFGPYQGLLNCFN